MHAQHTLCLLVCMEFMHCELHMHAHTCMHSHKSMPLVHACMPLQVLGGVDILYLKNVVLKFMEAVTAGRVAERDALLPAVATLLQVRASGACPFFSACCGHLAAGACLLCALPLLFASARFVSSRHTSQTCRLARGTSMAAMWAGSKLSYPVL